MSWIMSNYRIPASPFPAAFGPMTHPQLNPYSRAISHPHIPPLKVSIKNIRKTQIKFWWHLF